ncbi:MAG: hypothetical protein MI747_13525 [Desulfobacterales bacterium]|nr:hypothetical protein [Desulfobacterales bacterium]
MAISINSMSSHTVEIPAHVKTQSPVSPQEPKAIGEISITLSHRVISEPVTETLLVVNPVPVGPEGENSPLSDRELHALYRALGREMEPETLDAMETLLETLGRGQRETFLSLAQDPKVDLEALIREMNRLGGTETGSLLDTAQALGNASGINHLLTAVSTLDGEDLDAFLETARELAFNGNPGDGFKFVNAAAGDTAHIQELTATVRDLAEDSEQRSWFLNLAGDADDSLGTLLQVVGDMDGAETAAFLEAAQGAGKGLESLLDLTRSLGPERRGKPMNTLMDLDRSQREDFLVAAQGDVERMDTLVSLSRDLESGDKGRFFALAADASVDSEAVFDLFASLDGAGRIDFLDTAENAGRRTNDLIQMVNGLDAGKQGRVLALTAQLEFHDLNNFLNAAETTDGGLLAATANQLQGDSRSYFLYAASLDGVDAEALSQLTLKLSEENQANFLFIVANTQGGQADFLARVEAGKDGDLEGFLDHTRRDLEKSGRQGRAQTYVFLKPAFGERVFEKLMDSTLDPQKFMEKFNAMDGDQRENFIAVAEKAGADAMVPLIDLTLNLNPADSKKFMAQAQSLSGKALDDFITAADLSISHSGGDRTGFHKLLTLTAELDSGDRDNLLAAAAGAGKSLGRFLDLTDKLTGDRRSDFLTTAANITGRQVQGKPLLDFFLTTTEKLQSHDEPSFAFGIRSTGDHPSQLDMEALHSQVNQSSGYYHSAAWLSTKDLSDGRMADWFTSFLGIPAAYLDA